jgi:hypothetical protein
MDDDRSVTAKEVTALSLVQCEQDSPHDEPGLARFAGP